MKKLRIIGYSTNGYSINNKLSTLKTRILYFLYKTLRDRRETR